MSHADHHDQDGVSVECAEFLQSIVYLIDNELAEEDVVEVRLHIEGCTPCHQQYDVQSAMKSIVARSCTERAPESLRDRVRATFTQVEVTEITWKSH